MINFPVHIQNPHEEIKAETLEAMVEDAEFMQAVATWIYNYLGY